MQDMLNNHANAEPEVDTTAIDFCQAEPGRDIFDKKVDAKSQAHAPAVEEQKVDDAPAEPEVGSQEDEAERARKELFPDEAEA